MAKINITTSEDLEVEDILDQIPNSEIIDYLIEGDMEIEMLEAMDKGTIKKYLNEDSEPST